MPIEVWCLDWTRSFPYPFHIIITGTETSLPAIAIVFWRRDGKGEWLVRKSVGEFPRPYDRINLICFCFICHLRRRHHRCHCNQKPILSRSFCWIDFLIIRCSVLEKRAHGDWALISFYFCGNCMLIAGVAHERGCVSWKLNEANNFLSKFMPAPICTCVLICRYESLILYENYVLKIMKKMTNSLHSLECYN